MTFCQVMRVLVDPVSKTASGVKFRKDGKVYRVFAKKEVILSAGALNTPQVRAVGP